MLKITAKFRQLSTVLIIALIGVLPVFAQNIPLEAGTWAIEWSPDGTMLATANPGGKVYIYDSTGQLLQTLPGHERRAGAVTWSTNGQFLATSGWDGYVRIWDIQRGALVKEIEVFYGVFVMDWQPGGAYLLTATSDTLQAWNTNTWQVITFDAGITILDLEWNPKGTGFAIAYTGGLATATIEDEIFTGFERIEQVAVNSVDWSQDGTRLVAASGVTGDVTLWDMVNNQADVLFETDEAIWDAVFADEIGRKVIAVTELGNVYLLDANTDNAQSIYESDNWLWSVAWNPVDKLFGVVGTKETSSSRSTEESGLLEIGSLPIPAK